LNRGKIDIGICGNILFFEDYHQRQ